MISKLTDMVDRRHRMLRITIAFSEHELAMMSFDKVERVDNELKFLRADKRGELVLSLDGAFVDIRVPQDKVAGRMIWLIEYQSGVKAEIAVF